MEKEHEAHQALGDAASLMGKYDVKAEEDAIRKVLAGQLKLDDEVKNVDEVGQSDSFSDFFQRVIDASNQPSTRPPEEARMGIYADDLTFLGHALTEVFTTPHQKHPSGVEWEGVSGRLVGGALTNTRLGRSAGSPTWRARSRARGVPCWPPRKSEGCRTVAAAARSQTRSGPNRATSLRCTPSWIGRATEPSHPVVTQRKSSSFAVTAEPTYSCTDPPHDKRGQVVAASFMDVEFPDPSNPTFCLPTPLGTAAEAMELLDVRAANTGGSSRPGTLRGVDQPGDCVGHGPDGTARGSSTQRHN